LNLRPARSAERKRNWFPYSSNSMCGTSSTVRGKASSDGAVGRGRGVSAVWSSESVEYRGMDRMNIEFCFGKTTEGLGIGLTDTRSED